LGLRLNLINLLSNLFRIAKIRLLSPKIYAQHQTFIIYQQQRPFFHQIKEKGFLILGRFALERCALERCALERFAFVVERLRL
jgi:hypothetical protein